MRKATRIDWDGVVAHSPSTRRIRPVAWLKMSSLCGAFVFVTVLAALWRDLPGSPAPAVNLSDQLWTWLRAIIRYALRLAVGSNREPFGPEIRLAGLSSLEGPAGLRAAIAGALAILPFPLLAKRYLSPKDGLIHLRGPKRFERKKAVEAINKKLRDRVRRRPDHDLGPGLPYPADLWTRHVLLVGGTGAGKSTVIRPLIQKIVDANEKLIVFDPKGEFTEAFDLPLIAPWDSRSCGWDIGADMRNVGDMRRFAGAIVKEGHDPMWSNAAKQILVGFMLYLRDSRGTLWGWRELADMLSTPQEDLLILMWRYNREAVRAVEKASVTTTGILINLAAFCSPIYDLANAWGDLPEDRRISFVDWTLNPIGKRRQIILQGHGSYPDITKGYIQGIIGCVSAIVNSVELGDDPNRKLWIVADELPQMGAVPIRALFEVGRSRGLRCVVACQDFAQLDEIHGEKTVKALVSMSGTLLVGQIGRGETAEALAKALGAREVERRNFSSTFGEAGEGKGSRTLSFSRDELYIYKPSELGSRLGLDAERGGVVMALGLEGDAFELFWPHAPMRSIRAAHAPAAWTLGLDLARDDPRPATTASGTSVEAGWDPQGGEQSDQFFLWSAPTQHAEAPPAFDLSGQPVRSADQVVPDPHEYDYLFDIDEPLDERAPNLITDPLQGPSEICSRVDDAQDTWTIEVETRVVCGINSDAFPNDDMSASLRSDDSQKTKGAK
jgi:hypothetical protein